VFNVSIIICLVKETKNRIKLQQIKIYRKDSTVSKQMQVEYSSKKFSLNNKDASQPLSSKRCFSSTDKQIIEPNLIVSMQRRFVIAEFNSKKIIEQLALRLKHEKTNSQVRVVVTILLVNISFIILSTPLAILQIINQIRYNNAIKFKKAYSDEEDFETTKSLFELFQYINHSINFFLYCLGGQTFRTETKKLFNEIYFSIFKGR
jgi:hypothetical protein